MVNLTGMVFRNSEGNEFVFNIPEESRKETEYENYCATVKEEVWCAGGMLLGVIFERQEKTPYIPDEMSMSFSYKLGAMKKKVVLIGSKINFREGVKEVTLKGLIFETEKKGKNEFFVVPKQMKITFGKVTEESEEVTSSAGTLFLRLITVDE